MDGGLVLVPCLVVETKEECGGGVRLCEKTERRGILYVAGDGLVASLMESTALDKPLWLVFFF